MKREVSLRTHRQTGGQHEGQHAHQAGDLATCHACQEMSRAYLGPWPGPRFMARVRAIAAARATVAKVMGHWLTCLFPEPISATMAQMLAL
jgi:hypothetical protein